MIHVTDLAWDEITVLIVSEAALISLVCGWMHLPNYKNLIIVLGDTIQITLDTLIKISVLKHFRLTIKVSMSAKKKNCRHYNLWE